jgi:periplasmic divalent cation tolerance protein
MKDQARCRAVMIRTTVEKRDDAQRIGETILQDRLAACVQIEKIESMYWWKGALEHADELLLTFKTAVNKSEELQCRLLEIHPYETPEIIEVPISGGSEDYLAWVEAETRR